MAARPPPSLSLDLSLPISTLSVREHISISILNYEAIKDIRRPSSTAARKMEAGGEWKQARNAARLMRFNTLTQVKLDGSAPLWRACWLRNTQPFGGCKLLAVMKWFGMGLEEPGGQLIAAR